MVTKTLSTDSVQTASGVPGLNYDADNETWTINAGVIVYSQTGFGVTNESSPFAFVIEDFSNNTLINNGMIYTAATNEAGVNFNQFGGDGNISNARWATRFTPIVGRSTSTITVP